MSAVHFYLVIALLLAVVGVVFAVQNPTIVVLKFISWQFSGSFALMMLLAFLLGFVASFLVAAASALKRRMLISAQKRRIAELERQLGTQENAAALTRRTP